MNIGLKDLHNFTNMFIIELGLILGAVLIGLSVADYIENKNTLFIVGIVIVLMAVFFKWMEKHL